MILHYTRDNSQLHPLEFFSGKTAIERDESTPPRKWVNGMRFSGRVNSHATPFGNTISLETLLKAQNAVEELTPSAIPTARHEAP